MKRFVWTLTIIAVITGSLTLTAPFVFAQDYDGPTPTSTQGQAENIEQGEPAEDLPTLTQNWIYMGIGFVLMVAPFAWWFLKYRSEQEQSE